MGLGGDGSHRLCELVGGVPERLVLNGEKLELVGGSWGPSKALRQDQNAVSLTTTY